MILFTVHNARGEKDKWVNYLTEKAFVSLRGNKSSIITGIWYPAF